jgi:PAS domain S-box-containing protein
MAALKDMNLGKILSGMDSNEKKIIQDHLKNEAIKIGDLVEIMHFTENLSARIHGLSDPDLIYKTIAGEFVKSRKYMGNVMLLSEDGTRIRVAALSTRTKIVKLSEKATGLSVKTFSIDLSKTTYYKQVIKQGKTLLTKGGSLIEDVLSGHMAKIIIKFFGYADKNSIITPLRKKGKIIGTLSMYAPELAEYFIPSVKNLSRHITIALELAEENQRRRQAEQQAISILEDMGEAIIIFDFAGRIIQVNSRFEQGTGRKREEVIGLRTADLGLVSPEDAVKIENEVIPKLMKHHFVPDIEATSIRKDGVKIPISMNWSIMKDGRGRPYAIINVIKNISKLKETQAILKEFSGKILNIREDEKKKLSMDLHDEIGAMAVAMTTRLSLAEEEIKDKNYSHALDRIKQAKAQAVKATENIKKIAKDLRPSQLDITGLPGALREYAATTAKDTGLRIDINIKIGKSIIDDTAAISLYRIVQEAINNVVKHARAKRAAVRLSANNRSITLSVKDNGRGFDVERSLSRSRGIGIIGIKERIALLGGDFRITSGNKRGTEMVVVLPAVQEGKK